MDKLSNFQECEGVKISLPVRTRFADPLLPSGGHKLTMQSGWFVSKFHIRIKQRFGVCEESRE